MTITKIKHVVIIGGGFAGLWAARALRHEPVRITLIDRTNHHLFQPLLYQVATAGLAAPAISAPLRHILRNQSNLTTLMAEVNALDLDARKISFASQTLDYDFLLIASGATHSYFAHPEWEQFAPGLKTLDDAFVMRKKILQAFEQAEYTKDEALRRALLTFVVIGGGPTGVELAGTLAEISRHTLKSEFRNIKPGNARIILLEAGPDILPTFPLTLRQKARSQLQKLGVEVQTGYAVTSIDANGVALGDTQIASNNVLWAAGVAASPLGKMLQTPLDRAGRVEVNADLSIPNHPEVFVAGDLAKVMQNNRQVPGIAPAAKQMGRHVAEMIKATLSNRKTTEFYYRDYGNLATIGRHAAVVDFGRLRISGWLAWVFWLFAHVFFLIGFRNRLVVLIDWAMSYWTYQRHARVIWNHKVELPPNHFEK